MVIQISDQCSRAEISSLGAELQSYVTHGRERIWQRDPSLWSGSATVLFPFLGRCCDDSYLYRGKRYFMGLHGFAWKRDFRLLRRSSHSCVLELTDDGETRALYPFSFSLQVGFSLRDGVLSVRFRLQNRSHVPMPFALGWHPGFLLEESLTHYSLSFPEWGAPEEVEIVPKCLVTGRTLPAKLERGILPLTPDLFLSRARPYAGVGGQVQLRLSEKTLLQMDYPGFPITALWQTPGSGAPFLCVEPWLGRPGRCDRPEELGEDGKAVLPPGETFLRVIRLSFSGRRRETTR